MTREEFKERASARGLDDATIDLLFDQKYDGEESLSLMQPDQLNGLEISDKQRKALQKWLVDLYVQFNREDSSTTLEKEEKPTLSLKITNEAGGSKTELDYAEPSTPRPSIYEKCINVAVTGQVSSGKSSMINALRKLASKEPEAASTEVGHKQEGMLPYKHKTVENMVLWDLPAVEDISDEYLKKVEFDQYDAVIVCSSERLSEWDIWLATVAEKGHIRAFIVRTKIDRDIESDKDDYGEKHDEDKLLGKIRADIEGQVNKADVYLVSCKQQHWEQWGMPKLDANVAGVAKREQKPRLISPDDIKPDKTDSDKTEKNAAENAPDSDKISRISDKSQKSDKKDGKPLSKKEQIDQLAEKFIKEINGVVSKAAKKGNVSGLKKEIEKYKKEFGVADSGLTNVNIDTLEEAVDPLMVEKKGFKAKVLSCFGSRSQGAKSRESAQKVFDVISETAPALLRSAIDTCKATALDKLEK